MRDERILEGGWKSYEWRDVRGGLERVRDGERDFYVKEGILGGAVRGGMARGRGRARGRESRGGGGDEGFARAADLMRVKWYCVSYLHN